MFCWSEKVVGSEGFYHEHFLNNVANLSKMVFTASLSMFSTEMYGHCLL